MNTFNDFENIDMNAGDFLQELAQKSQRCTYIIQDNKFIFANNKFVELLDLPPSEIAAAVPEKLFNSIIHPDFRQQAKCFYSVNSDQPNMGSNMEIKIINRSGRVCWINLEIQAIHRDSNEMLFGLIMDITKRKNTEESLAISEKRYRQIFEHSKDAILITKMDASISDINKAAEQLTGYTKAELLRMNVKDICHLDNQHTHEDIYSRIMVGEEVIKEAFIKRKDNSRVPVELSKKRIIIHGIPFVHTVARDITTRKQAEQALRDSELFNRAVIENSPLGVSVRSKTGKLLSCNRSWQKIWNKSDEDIREDLTRERNELKFNENDDYLEVWQPKIRRVYIHGGHLHIPEAQTIGHRHKEENWVSQYFYAISNDQGEVDKVVILTEDITERKRMENALRDSEARYRTVLNAAPLYIYVINLEGFITFIDGKQLAIDGLVSKDVVGKSIFDLYKLPETGKLFDAALKGKFTHITNVVNNKTYESRLERQFSADGEVVGLIGISTDITEIKKAKEALQDTEMKFCLLFDNAGQPIFSVNRNGVFLTINSTAAAYLGGNPEDFIDKSLKDLFPKKIAEHQLAKVRQAIDSGQKIIDEDKTIINGQVIWYIMSIQPIVDSDGRINSALLIVNDITQRKQLENRDKAKSELLNDLRQTTKLNECLHFGCQAIFKAQLYNRSIILIINKNCEVTHYSQTGFLKSKEKDILKAIQSDKTLLQIISQNGLKISHSYFMPMANSIFKAKANKSNRQGNAVPVNEKSWQAGDQFFVPLMAEKNKPEGWVIVDSPFNGKWPGKDEAVFLEELADIIVKKVHEIQSLETLQEERLTLQEKNITLREVLAHIEEEKMEIKYQVAREIENSLIPVMNKLIKKSGSINRTYYNILEQGLQDLASSAGTRHIFSKLSPREVEICNIIKTGASSKELAKTLNISLATVQKHRESIRRKLGITNKNVNLMTYLKG